MDQMAVPFHRSSSMVSFKQNLTIRHLRLISTLARELNISRCADALNTSQSAISRGLSEIEDVLGVKLFDRSTRRITPTSPGQNLIWHADQILSQLDQAQADFSALALGAGGELKIGVMGGVSPETLHHAIELAREQAPTLKVKLYCDPAEALMADFTNGRFNLMVTHFDTRKVGSEDLGIDVLYEERVGILCGRGHRLAGKRVSWRDLAHEDWAITPVETAPRRIIEREIMIHTGTKMRVVIETKEAHYLVASLQSDNMVGALPFQAAQWHAKFGAAALIELEEETRFSICAVFRKTKAPSLTETLFLNCIKEAAHDLVTKTKISALTGFPH